MKRWQFRVRYYALTLAACSLTMFNGCGLSDQQWASIWQSMITSGLNTVVGNVLTTATDTAAS